MATPRKTEYPLAGRNRSWVLRSAGGARPALVIWGDPQPGDPVLDRLARSGFGVITPSAGMTEADLVALLDGLPQGTALGGTSLTAAGVACVGPPAAPELTRVLETRRIPWRQAEDDWDGLVRWFAERLT